MSFGSSGSKSSSSSQTTLHPYQRRVADPFTQWLTSMFEYGPSTTKTTYQKQLKSDYELPGPGEEEGWPYRSLTGKMIYPEEAYEMVPVTTTTPGGVIGMKGATPYEGQFVAPLTEQESQVINELMAYYPEAQSAFSKIANLNPEELSRRFAAQYADPAKKYWEEIVNPTIREAYGGPGSYYSSERMEAERKAAEDLATELAAQESAFRTEAETRAMEAALGGAEYAKAAGEVTALPRELRQKELEATYQEFLRVAPEYSPYIDYILKLLTGPWETTSTGEAKESGFNIGLGSIGVTL